MLVLLVIQILKSILFIQIFRTGISMLFYTKIVYNDEDSIWGMENGKWCGMPSNCKLDLICGPLNNNSICPSHLCCGKDGYCGSTEVYCGTSCQSRFGGVCNNN